MADINMPKSVKLLREYYDNNKDNAVNIAYLSILILRMCQFEPEKSLKKLEILMNRSLSAEELSDLRDKYRLPQNVESKPVNEEEEDVSEYVDASLEILVNESQEMVFAKTVIIGFVVYVWLEKRDDAWILERFFIISEEDLARFLVLHHPKDTDWIFNPDVFSRQDSLVDDNLIF